jgi:hypothetical protein
MDASLLPPAWKFRSPQFSDLQAVTDLIIACEEADYGKADAVIADLLAEWQRPGFDPSSEARLLLAADNRLAGYTDFWLKPGEVQYAFSEFYRRGQRSAGLIVDSQNPTGAPQFYMRARMVPVEKLVTYNKWIDLDFDNR